MFYEACERLASEHPQLRTEIESLDKLLAQNSENLVTLELLRTHIETTDAVLEDLFNALCADDDFASEEALYCIEHNQTFPKEGTCDLCDTDSVNDDLQERIAIRSLVPSTEGEDQPDRPPIDDTESVSYTHLTLPTIYSV